MKRFKKNLTRVFTPVLLLTVILSFSQCKKEETEAPSNLPRAVDSQSAVATVTPTTLTLSNSSHNGGYALKVTGNFGTTGDSQAKPTISKLRLFENGRELGAAHSEHANIRNIGRGKFSHWGSALIFSASDNTDPRTNGRKYTFTTGATPTTATVVQPAPTAPTAPIVSNSPIGYAMVNGTTTGGKGGQTVTVSTLSALKSAVASSSPVIIKVSGTIRGSEMLRVSSNKTIVGSSGAKLSGVGFLIYSANNIIIQNLIIENVVGGDCITIKESSHHIWVDHCDLSADKSHGWDYYDGLIDITNKSNYITVSWNKIHDSHKAMLIGASYSATTDAGTLKVTINNNSFTNISERTPDAKFGNIHMFNNYFNQATYVGAFMGAIIRLDNNYWQNSSLPIRTDLSSTPGRISGLTTNVFNACGANRITTSASTWVPTYEYQSALIATSQVPSKITAGAGATL